MVARGGKDERASGTCIETSAEVRKLESDVRPGSARRWERDYLVVRRADMSQTRLVCRNVFVSPVKIEDLNEALFFLYYLKTGVCVNLFVVKDG